MAARDAARRPDAGTSVRGSVLVPVLVVLVLISYLAVEVARDLTTDYASASYIRGALDSAWLMDDAEELAARVLVLDAAKPNHVDYPLESWGLFQDELDLFMGGSNVEMTGAITDEQGLFPLNALVSTSAQQAVKYEQFGVVFMRLVQGFADAYGVDGEPKDFLDSVRYWMGDIRIWSDDDDWYGSHEPPYERPGRPMRTPMELLLVHWKDVSEEDKRKVLLGVDGNPGLVDVVTTWGRDVINMNTAVQPVVMAMLDDGGKRLDYWTQVRNYRLGAENPFDGTWYVDLAKTVGADLTQFPAQCLGVQSSAFSLRLTCQAGGTTRRLYTVFERYNNGDIRVVFRQSY